MSECVAVNPIRNRELVLSALSANFAKYVDIQISAKLRIDRISLDPFDSDIGSLVTQISAEEDRQFLEDVNHYISTIYIPSATLRHIVVMHGGDGEKRVWDSPRFFTYI
jgi:hypothetical protein